MFTYKSACFGSQLKYRQGRCIVNIKRSIVQFLYLIVELSPFVRSELTALDFLTGDLAHIHNQTVHQLYVTHFQREQCNGNFIVYGHILRHREYECCLTHRRTGSNNNKVGILPAGSHLVELRQTTQTVGSCRRFLKHLIRFLNDRINLRIVFLHVLLRDFEEFSFGFLHQIVYILSLVERLCLDVAGKRDQLACQKLLGDDTSMIFDMGRRSYLTT